MIRQPAAEKLVRQLLELRLYRTSHLSADFVATMAKIVMSHVSLDEQAEQRRCLQPNPERQMIVEELIAKIRALHRYDCHGAEGDYNAGMEPGDGYVDADELDKLLYEFEQPIAAGGESK